MIRPPRAARTYTTAGVDTALSSFITPFSAQLVRNVRTSGFGFKRALESLDIIAPPRCMYGTLDDTTYWCASDQSTQLVI